MRSEHRSYIRCDEVVAMQCAVRWISLHSSNALRVPELFSALHWERLALFPISSALPDFVCGPHCAHLARRMCRSCAVRLQQPIELYIHTISTCSVSRALQDVSSLGYSAAVVAELCYSEKCCPSCWIDQLLRSSVFLL